MLLRADFSWLWGCDAMGKASTNRCVRIEATIVDDVPANQTRAILIDRCH